jgi:hypothetical protein
LANQASIVAPIRFLVVVVLCDFRTHNILIVFHYIRINMSPKKKRSNKRSKVGKPQAPAAIVVAHSNTPDSPYSDGCFNFVNDANQIASLISLCIPVSIRTEFESNVVKHIHAVFSSIGQPSFKEIASILTSIISGYNQCRRSHPSLLTQVM